MIMQTVNIGRMIRFKRWLWRQFPHRAYVYVGTVRCYRCGCHYNSWHKGY